MKTDSSRIAMGRAQELCVKVEVDVLSSQSLTVTFGELVTKELRVCVKVEVDVLGFPVPNKPYGLCGREATLQPFQWLPGPLLSLRMFMSKGQCNTQGGFMSKGQYNKQGGLCLRDSVTRKAVLCLRNSITSKAVYV